MEPEMNWPEAAALIFGTLCFAVVLIYLFSQQNDTPERSACSIRQFALVRFDISGAPAHWHAGYAAKGLISDQVYVFFGEIPNMPGHCVVMNHKTGQMLSGIHTENFKEIAEDET
jgi:hypothetical protein